MSEAIQNNDTPSQCDRLLDYAYGELTGDDLEQFKLHLLGCEKCKRELAGLERVRSAVKQAMPEVEPPVDKMAQLMLAAAQQKPKRGKVLMFARRVVSHPAYAAAAVFVLVATSVTINWSRHALQMPPESAAPVIHEPVEKETPALAQPITATPAEANPTAALEKDGFRDKNKEPNIVLKTEPAGAFTVRRAPSKKSDQYVLDGHMASGGGLLADSPAGVSSSGGPVGGKDYKRADDGVGRAAHHGKSEFAASDEEKPADLPRQEPARPAPKPQEPAKLRAVATPQEAPQAVAKPPAPAKVAYERGDAANEKKAALGEGGRLTNEGQTAAGETTIANQAPGRESPMVAQNQAASRPTAVAPAAPPPAAPAPPTAAPPPAHSTTALAETRQKGLDSNFRQQKPVDPNQVKKQFLELAKSGRCSEAVNLFQQIERQYSGLMTTSDRAQYSYCLRKTNQNDLADTEDRVIEGTKLSAPPASKKASRAKAKKSSSADSDAILAPAAK